jgi:hypothetical protein
VAAKRSKLVLDISSADAHRLGLELKESNQTLDRAIEAILHYAPGTVELSTTSLQMVHDYVRECSHCKYWRSTVFDGLCDICRGRGNTSE